MLFLSSLPLSLFGSFLAFFFSFVPFPLILILWVTFCLMFGWASQYHGCLAVPSGHSKETQYIGLIMCAINLHALLRALQQCMEIKSGWYYMVVDHYHTCCRLRSLNIHEPVTIVQTILPFSLWLLQTGLLVHWYVVRFERSIMLNCKYVEVLNAIWRYLFPELQQCLTTFIRVCQLCFWALMNLW